MRKIICTITVIFFIIIAFSCNKPARILIITGGHSYDTVEFYDLFRSLTGIQFDSVSYPAAKEILSSDEVSSYDVLVFYDYNPDLPQEDSSIFLNLTRQGKSMLFLHHAICTFQEWDGYMHMIGGKYVMPGYTEDSSLLSDYTHDIEMQIEVVANSHPVTRDIDNFLIHDEGYSNLLLLEDVVPILETDHINCSPIVAWSNGFNESTIVYLLLGHDKSAYTNTSFPALITNAIHWLAGE